MIKKSTVYNFFKFLEDKRGEKIPFISKLILDPESLSEEDLYVKGNLNINHYDLPVLKLPNNIIIDGNLFMEQNGAIERLPNGIRVNGSIFATQSSLKYLPNNLIVGRSLWMTYSDLEKLPNNLKIGSSLMIEGTEVEEVPYNLQVTGDLFCDDTPLIEKYTENEIKKMIEDKGGHVKEVRMD